MRRPRLRSVSLLLALGVAPPLAAYATVARDYELPFLAPRPANEAQRQQLALGDRDILVDAVVSPEFRAALRDNHVVVVRWHDLQRLAYQP